MIEDEIYAMKDIKCCACGCKLAPSDGMNVTITMKRATWKCPVYGSLDDPDYPPRAVAILCDDCDRNNVPVRLCVEFQGNGRVKYHEVESLEDVSEAACKMKIYFGKKFELGSAARNKLMLRAASERGVN